jgi:hypothetical protein
MIGPAWLRWPLVGRLATDCTVGPLRWEPGSLVACSARRQVEAVINRDSGPGQGLTVGPTQRGQEPGEQQGRRGPEGGRADAPRHHPGWGVGWVSDRAAAKATTHLNVALTHLDEAARLAREAGLPGQSGLLERLAREATEALAELQAAPQPTPPADKAAMP